MSSIFCIKSIISVRNYPNKVLRMSKGHLHHNKNVLKTLFRELYSMELILINILEILPF